MLSRLARIRLTTPGDRLSPSYCIKKGRRYRYYIVRNSNSRTGWRLPAKTVDAAVLNGIAGFLRDKQRLIADLLPQATPARRIESLLSRAAQLGEKLPTESPTEQRSILQETVDRIEVTQDRIRINLNMATLRLRFGVDENNSKDTESRFASLTVDIPIALKRRGVETKLVIHGKSAATPNPDPALINAVRSASKWFKELNSGGATNIRELAERHHTDKGDVSRILPLAFLAPDIIEAILDGQQPVELTAYRLKRLRDLPLLWSEQRRVLGFS